ncbi:BatD family protein [Sulfurimonas xiamenensis]|uniref:Protein BatD n=1 Tax=Sulfurimonas xiamenensis TaxID=2590021 RepID=A0AAJ4A2Y0_9BACT|nr:BatD family protein [Sulfurimonas xiamenensis]QFR42932.1 protein BatD [Sulfurimonas xiamenensis]
MNTILKLLFLLFVSSHGVYAEVIAKVDSKTVELGEMVTYSLNISGEEITRPNIKRLCDSDVISTSSQTSMQIINGNISKNYVLSYKFVPQKSCTIEPVEVEVDGKIESSNSLEIKVVPVSGTKDLDFVLKLQSDKKELFVGETFDMTLTFKQRKNAEAVDSKFTSPELKGFWVKNESKPQKYEDGKYIITEIVYTMAPQRAGELKITKAQMQVASRSSKVDSWGSWIPSIKWKTYFSNELSFDVKPLPKDINLVGDFSISATVDKTEIEANEAVNCIVEVLGSGNLEDIESFKPEIQGVAVFEEKGAIEGDKLTQKLVFVAEKEFSVPEFTLKYFNPKTKEIKTVSTKEIPIHVKNAKSEEVLNIKRQESRSDAQESIKITQIDSSILVIIFVFGLVCGVLIMIFKEKINFKKEHKISIKDPKNLLVKLLEFKHDPQVEEIIDILEKNIYQNQNIEIDKKSVTEVLKKYKIN